MRARTRPSATGGEASSRVSRAHRSYHRPETNMSLSLGVFRLHYHHVYRVSAPYMGIRPVRFVMHIYSSLPLLWFPLTRGRHASLFYSSTSGDQGVTRRKRHSESRFLSPAAFLVPLRAQRKHGVVRHTHGSLIVSTLGYESVSARFPLVRESEASTRFVPSVKVSDFCRFSC